MRYVLQAQEALQQWFAHALDTSRSVPADVLLLCILWALLASLIAFMLGLRKVRLLRAAFQDVQRELAELRAQYESEVKWRMAADLVLKLNPAEQTKATNLQQVES